MGNFDEDFQAFTGKSPFPWQRALFHRLCAGEIPVACDIPTGLGKTSVIAIWLLARSEVAKLPTRLVYVVNRRTVVDQTTVEVERIRERLASAEPTQLHERLAGAGLKDLAISTLRGKMADNRAWSEDPSKPAVICGTVDMIGSRLLFSGYRIGFKGKPLHAGFLGQDALLVHDEAHLEPSFQTLLDSIVMEQKRCHDRWPLRVMALTATQRKPQDALGPGGVGRARAMTTSGTPREQQEAIPLRLSDEDYADLEIKKRIEATKRLSLHLHDANGLVDKVVAQVLTYKQSERAVLVFLRTVDDVGKAAARLGKAGLQTEQLTGTMRGYERDGLVNRNCVFNRFLPKDDRNTSPAEGTVVLVCTSAGEVGVNLSADHLVCDLSTFDAMAQRFGRVNRFGDRPDSEVHVFHPPADVLEADEAPRTQALLATLALLRRLDGNASPRALGTFDPEERSAAFAPVPRTVPATDIVFDKWALTSIRGELPGRPPVGAYLHGVPEWEPPTTQVAWRTEVDRISKLLLERYPPADLLDDYTLKPHELLSDRTSRIVETLVEAGARVENALAVPIWIVEEDGEVEVETLEKLLGRDRKRLEERLAGVPARSMRARLTGDVSRSRREFAG